MSNYNFLMLLNLVTFLVNSVFVILFGRISVKHIEMEMAKDDVEQPEWDKGIGARYLMYAFAIVIKKKRRDFFINIDAVQKHARTIDKYLAYGFCLTSMFWLALMVVTCFVLDL